jgi:PIN domain nuclease of toxin-antitoxin system
MSLEPVRLSEAGSAAIREARTSGLIHISDISLWEVAQLALRGRIEIAGTIDAFVYAISAPVVVKPITAAIASMAVKFSEQYPKDPADRLIGATSIVEGLPLVTADEKLRNFLMLNTIW